MKYLLIIFVVFMTIVYTGNYFDYKRGKITRKQYERNFRLSILLILFLAFIYFMLRKR
ncbi:MAG: hypothetical protein REI78_01355 [Pedobacter sp.]|nr:hypothetical protein [Pedobacter sp.]MDQ8051635.1 hypothetical protein [Pedobacter sp.]